MRTVLLDRTEGLDEDTAIGYEPVDIGGAELGQVP